MPPCPSGVGAFAAFSSRSLTILQIAESSAHTPPVCAHRRFVTRSFAPFGRVTPQSDPGGRRAMDDAREARARSPFLNTKQAAAWLSLSARTLEKMRVRGRGPRYRKHGGVVRYPIADLDSWSAGRAKTRTRQEARRGGKECGMTCRARGAPD